MISRPTLIAALVVVELAIVGSAFRVIGGGGSPPSFGFTMPAGPVMGHGSTPVDRTFVTGFTPRVAVDVGGIDVTVETGTSPSVRVIETSSSTGIFGSGETVDAQQTSDGIRVSSSSAGHSHFSLGMSPAVRLIVPPGARIELASAGTIDISGMRAKVIAHTSDGHIHVHDQQGDLDVTTDDGQIELVQVSGNAIDAVSHKGRIYLTRVGADRINAHSDYGRIVGEGVRVVNGALTTDDGRVKVSFTPSSDATANVYTSGDITVTGFPSRNGDENHRTVQLGSGRGHLDISTDGGDDITITPGANG